MGDGNVPSFAGTRTDDVDFSNARLHAPNFEGARITDGWFVGADISGDLEGLRLNGGEGGRLVLAELERRGPGRGQMPAGAAVSGAGEVARGRPGRVRRRLGHEAGQVAAICQALPGAAATEAVGAS